MGRRVFALPLWVIRPLMFLGVVWLVFGLADTLAVYILSLIFAAIFGYVARRRIHTTVLERSDKGLIVWHRSRKDHERNPIPPPRIEFDSSSDEAES